MHDEAAGDGVRCFLDDEAHSSQQDQEMSGCPVKEDALSSSGCPVKHDAADNSRTWMSFLGLSSSTKSASSTLDGGYNAAAGDEHFSSTNRYPGQKYALDTKRQMSSIPKGEISPDHQPQNAQKWVYPSEQQYFNAMKRKGYDPAETDVPVVLAIHNLVNERGWSDVKKWEAISGHTAEPKLKQFLGKPKDISPKAYFLSMFGYSLPFDRHDWIISRGNGTDVRYVIDFYKGKEKAKSTTEPVAPISIYLDVRPALDSPEALINRMYVGAREQIFGDSIESLTRSKGTSRTGGPSTSTVSGTSTTVSSDRSTANKDS